MQRSCRGRFGSFFSARRFRVAVIFKGLYEALSELLGVFSKRALVSVSPYLIGGVFVIDVRPNSHW
jgi:hypothetical protein